ncbi:hypothetical protein JCM24511_07215 [Saitozyma sp. JCM 24511]|nr:hypothetical protein JCM24511_07215 [Saitozyma sp. JCM 24511]
MRSASELQDIVDRYHLPSHMRASLTGQYERDGYVVVPHLIPPELLDPLSLAADRVTDRARSGGWSQVRVVGKQFPPWVAGDDVWGVQNLMHPDLGEGVFAEWYGSEGMLEVSAALMGCRVEDMQFGTSTARYDAISQSSSEPVTSFKVILMLLSDGGSWLTPTHLELFNLLVNPLEKTYALSWHRDDIKPTVSPSEESEALGIKHHGIQWNAALYDDECLSAVPGSHRRVRTPAEREANLSGGAMPGGKALELKKGETVFYNNNILHVGKYNPLIKRRTLHGCYGSPPPGDTARARNILQHDLSYATDPAFRKGLPERLRPMLDRLNGMQREMEGREVGYSQDL